MSSGGDELEKFAKVAGVSSEEFASSFGTEKFGPVFLKFINGLDSIGKSGGDTVKTLGELGITSVRDVPALLRLATAADSAGKSGALLNQTLKDASEQQSAGTTLDQYGIIAATVAAKISLLQNNFNALLVTIGDGGGIFGGLLDTLNEVLKTLTDIAANPVANFFAQLALILTGVVGVLALVGAAATLGYAGIIGLTQALVGMSAGALGGNVSLSGLLVTMRATGPAGVTAAAGIGLVSKAIKALSLIGIALILPDIAKWASDTIYGLKGLDASSSETAKRVKEDFKDGLFGDLHIDQLNGFTAGVQRFFAAFDEGGVKDLQRVDESISALATGGDIESALTNIKGLSSGFTEAGGSLDSFRSLFPDTIKSLEAAGVKITEAKDGTILFSGATADAATKATDLAAATDLIAESMGLTAEELKSFTDALIEGGTGFVQLGDLIQRNQDQTRGWAEQQSKATYGSTESWQEFYDGVSINLQKFNEDLDAQVAALANWEKNLTTLVGRGVDEGVIAQLAKMGPEAAPLLQALVDDTTGTAQQVIDKLGQAGETSVTDFANNVTENTPLLRAAFAAGGDEAVAALSTALGQGDAAVAAVMAQYNITAANNPILITAKPAEAQIRGALNSVISWINGTQVSVNLGVTATGRPVNRGAFADGGAVFGPGSGTSDSIPARLSNGEYVIRAASVRKYGMGMFDQLNRGVAKFASGGPVQRFAGGGSVAPMGISPRQLRGAPTGDIIIQVDGFEIARAVNKANAQSGNMGSN